MADWNPDTYNRNDTLPRGIASEVPNCGTYVVFKLNPAETVEALRDPKATEQALSLPTRRYIGILLEASLFDIKGFSARRYYSGELALVSRGLPKSSPAEGIEEGMCIPIDSATHPAGRAGVSPTPPLPWDNLYHPTAVSFDVRVSTHPEGPIDDSKSPMLCLKDLTFIAMTSADDTYRSMELAGVLEEDDSEEPADSEVSFGEGASLPAYSIRSGEDSEAGRDMDVVMSEFLSQGLASRADPRVEFRPVVDFDLDLSTVSEFTSAEGLSGEIKELERYATSTQDSLSCSQRATQNLGRGPRA
ncbi:hypothetical protein FA95DRAFT_1482908 [Auriscalpium vulgare]|uniref:Uncharacterized protein n=1 Tax=Auriscalpium vulgare TaxID=40419 RepID=A0ACB8S9U2_9AGAM|nr:hypothetical protein FA95DRAFT_1482908 [Auriscalpium vulgare]